MSRKNVQSTIFPQRQSVTSVTVTTKRLDEVQTINTPQRDDIKHSSKTINKEHAASAQSSGPSTKTPSKKSQTETKISSTKKPLRMSSSTGQIPSVAPASSALVKAVRESDYTPSISSIGSNVLRSKTADFERILSDQNKKSRISGATMNLPALQTTHNVQSLQAKIQPPSPSVTTNINISLKNTSNKKKSTEESTATGHEKRAPIYKRQEIIASVQKTVKK